MRTFDHWQRLLVLALPILTMSACGGVVTSGEEQVGEVAAQTLVGTAPDTDGDGFADAREAYLGTDPSRACAINSSDSAWPADFNNDRKVDTADAQLFAGKINLAATTPELRRFDLNQDGKVTLSDVLMLRSFIGKTCYPTIGAGPDTDHDGFSDSREVYLGTDSSRACSWGGRNAWPVDFNDDRTVDMADAQLFAGKMNLPVTTPELRRFDLNEDGRVSLSDVLTLSPFFGKTCTPVIGSGLDSDQDGFSDSLEAYLGTNPSRSCALTAQDNAWPADFNNDRVVDTADARLFAGKLNQAVTTPELQRFDLKQDGILNISDVVTLIPFFNKTCSPW